MNTMTPNEFGAALDHWLLRDPPAEPDHAGLIPDLAAEFNEFELAGHNNLRDPREFLLDRCADDVVGAAYLIATGKTEDGQRAFAAAIEKARAGYVDHYLSDYAEELVERSREDEGEAWAMRGAA